MGVSILDGTIEEAVLKRSVRNIRIFRHVRFRLRDGGTKSVAKPIVDASVAHLLQPGTSGRFYLYTSIDQRGIHGVRDDQGHAEFGFPRNNEIAMLVVMLINLVWVSVALVAMGECRSSARSCWSSPAPIISTCASFAPTRAASSRATANMSRRRPHRGLAARAGGERLMAAGGSRSYRPAGGVATLAQALLCGTAGLAAVAALLAGCAPARPARGQPARGRGRLVQLVVWVAAFVITLRWIYLANNNARALGADDMIVTPGWAVGWFFVPAAEPGHALHRGPRDAGRRRQPLRRGRPGAPLTIPLWWAFPGSRPASGRDRVPDGPGVRQGGRLRRRHLLFRFRPSPFPPCSCWRGSSPASRRCRRAWRPIRPRRSRTGSPERSAPLNAAAGASRRGARQYSPRAPGRRRIGDDGVVLDERPEGPRRRAGRR